MLALKREEEGHDPKNVGGLQKLEKECTGLINLDVSSVRPRLNF